MYKILQDHKTGEVFAALRIADNTSFVFDPANVDYQAYLAWLAEGNVPTPADQPTE